MHEHIRTYRLDEAEYPPLLAEIARPPAALHVRGYGDALAAPLTVAVVGTRKMTPYGNMAVRRIVPPLARAGVVIVSGLAFGTDAAAHRATLDADGITVAVLGSGVDAASVSPRGNAALGERIAERGALVSAYAPGTSPLAHHFPERNHVIAGLSRAVVVIEAPMKSGALITAYAALDANRDVYAVPGPIDAPMSEGTNILITKGAIPLLSADQLLSAYGVVPTPTARPAVAGDAARILDILSDGTLPVDLISLRAKLPTHAVFVLLTELELAGFVRAEYGRYTLEN